MALDIFGNNLKKQELEIATKYEFIADREVLF
jgi:hypothetical protein